MPDVPTGAFAALGLGEVLVRNLAVLGYEVPTPIQERTVPLLLAGRDLIGQAQTGTGKTAAFALPILQKLDPSQRRIQALVLTPTRELAMQVAEAFHSYARGIEPHVSVIPVYGGAPIGAQLRRLERGVHVVVGTPGRLVDHLDRGTLDLSSIDTVVLDEADEMLKMGFLDDVERILSASPPGRQTALFSATMPAAIAAIARRHLREPERVAIEHRTMTAPATEQRFVNLSEGQKLDVLTRMLELEAGEAALIFRRTKTGAAELAERLEARGFAAVAMHGDMNQPMREAVVRRLRKGEIDLVVATDVAARGLDVDRIAHVVNYDVPYDVEAYVHRIGRTGRAGRSGKATLFVTPRERRMMREIERFTGSAIRPMRIPTHADVAARRVEMLKETIRREIGEEEGLDLYLGVVEQLAVEGPFDVADVAAAALRLASRARPIEPAREEPAVEPAPESARRPGRGRTEGARPEAKVRLALAVGRRDGIRPADVVGSIANEAGIAGREIGPIDIGEDETIVAVPERHRDAVIEAMRGARFRGRPFSIRLAGAPAAAAARREPPARRAPKPAAGEGTSRPKPREGFYSPVARPHRKSSDRRKPPGPRGPRRRS
ncbi:MAG TPA: DEAD/DEAH box helicase [Thermoanaerobaculia bacterium]|nr:DEAD/DEAH box helicase [Thermoanaerobaculia bacterium]